MQKLKTSKFLLRIFVIFLIHFVFKLGDLSFTPFYKITNRGVTFTVFFIIFWIIAWYAAELINNTILKPSHRKNKLQLVMLFGVNFIYGLLMSSIFNFLYRYGDIVLFNNSKAWESVMLFNPELTLSLFTFYMMVFLFDFYYQENIKRKEEQLEMERIQKDNTLAQYLNLKSQIEPHFLFNSLSVLSSLIQTNTDLASDFVLRLSRLMRFVVEKNEMLLVPLSEELDFVENYLFLIQTRFDDGIVFENHLEKMMVLNNFIPPAAIQSLIENAIKHNKFSGEVPLKIKLYSTKNRIVISNNLNLRKDEVNSTKQGLENLKARFSHFTNDQVTITQSKTEFIVSLPLLNEKPYERFNI